jgi:hypothetical protein
MFRVDRPPAGASARVVESFCMVGATGPPAQPPTPEQRDPRRSLLRQRPAVYGEDPDREAWLRETGGDYRRPLGLRRGRYGGSMSAQRSRSRHRQH